MRRRSNAIHSDSTEGFLLLAELSQDAPGYFYDDKIREEIDRRISKNKPVFPNPEHVYQPKLEGFDFNSEIQCAMEEKTQLEIKGKRQVLQLTIKTNDVKELKTMLTLIFTPQKTEMEENNQTEKLILDIIMVPHKDILLKIWIVNCDQKNNPLLETYKNKPFNWNYNPSQGKNLQHLKALIKQVIIDLQPKLQSIFP